MVDELQVVCTQKQNWKLNVTAKLTYFNDINKTINCSMMMLAA